MMSDYIKNPTHRGFYLYGSGGTGKSTIMGFLILLTFLSKILFKIFWLLKCVCPYWQGVSDRLISPFCINELLNDHNIVKVLEKYYLSRSDIEENWIEFLDYKELIHSSHQVLSIKMS